MAPNGVPKPKTENAWQVWQVTSIVTPIRLPLPLLFLLLFVEVLKKAAIPAIVLRSPHKRAKNSMAGRCNNLP
jgi:hypothetical protein